MLLLLLLLLHGCRGWVVGRCAVTRCRVALAVALFSSVDAEMPIDVWLPGIGCAGLKEEIVTLCNVS